MLVVFFCCQICSLARFLSLDRSCIPFSFHRKCCNKLASLITWFSPISVCKSLLSVLYSTVVDLADPIMLHPVSAVLGTWQVCMEYLTTLFVLQRPYLNHMIFLYLLLLFLIKNPIFLLLKWNLYIVFLTVMYASCRLVKRELNSLKIGFTYRFT